MLNLRVAGEKSGQQDPVFILSWKWMVLDKAGNTDTCCTKPLDGKLIFTGLWDTQKPINQLRNNMNPLIKYLCYKRKLRHFFFKSYSLPLMFSTHLVCVQRQRQVVSPIMTLENKMSPLTRNTQLADKALGLCVKTLIMPLHYSFSSKTNSCKSCVIRTVNKYTAWTQ